MSRGPRYHTKAAKLRLPPVMYARLETFAKERGLNRSQAIRVLINTGLRNIGGYNHGQKETRTAKGTGTDKTDPQHQRFGPHASAGSTSQRITV